MIRNSKEKRTIASLGSVSRIGLGGAPLLGGWGQKPDKKLASTILKKAVQKGINLIDVAPDYGDGEVELLIGDTFGGVLPQDLKIGSKLPLSKELYTDPEKYIKQSLHNSLKKMKIDHLDTFILHSRILPDNYPVNELGTEGIHVSVLVDKVYPILEKLQKEGFVSCWGISGLHIQSAVEQAIISNPTPCIVQVITNLLNSPGEGYEGIFNPEQIIEKAVNKGVTIAGVRVVGRGALSDYTDRIKMSHFIEEDFIRSKLLRDLALELKISTAILAMRFVLSMKLVDILLIGISSISELDESIEAWEQGALDIELLEKIKKMFS